MAPAPIPTLILDKGRPLGTSRVMIWDIYRTRRLGQIQRIFARQARGTLARKVFSIMRRIRRGVSASKQISWLVMRLGLRRKRNDMDRRVLYFVILQCRLKSIFLEDFFSLAQVMQTVIILLRTSKSPFAYLYQRQNFEGLPPYI